MKIVLTREEQSTLEFIMVMLKGFMQSPNAKNFKAQSSHSRIDADGFKDIIKLNFVISDNIKEILKNDGYKVFFVDNTTEIYKLS